jgi:ABC-2 type transport system ATP-binding protein
VCDRIAIIDHGNIIAINTPEALVDLHRNDTNVISVSRKGKITLEDVFIGLTGKTVRS